MKHTRICATDLFCGAGGLTNGLIRSGIDVRLGVDIDEHCVYPYTANNSARFLLRSVELVGKEEITPFLADNCIRLLAGCAPCQTFSTYNQKAKETDKRWWLLRHFARLVQEMQPELVAMENVPNLLEQNVFQEFCATLTNEGYHITYSIVKCAEYGVPQDRKRLVCLASKFGAVNLLTPREFGASPRTVRDAIESLPKLEAGAQDPEDPLHRSAALTPLNLKRIRASSPGGTWRDWPEELMVTCHRKATGKNYSGVYGRMTWDMPSPTITTQFYGFGNGRFGHPEQDRALSLREGAILQTFPPEYVFFDPGKPVQRKIIGKLIGNAVPVVLGEVIGRSLITHVAQAAEQ
ncbi:MAG: DNA cytosine methyltransferase [Lachnospiraceae bacterium]|nr:DNA cytosine methyltransferase [Lachnospiraceae bacterium]